MVDGQYIPNLFIAPEVRHDKTSYTTAHIQPMDAGIIGNFKGFYRGLLVCYFLRCIEDGQEQVVSIKTAITYVKEAW